MIESPPDIYGRPVDIPVLLRLHISQPVGGHSLDSSFSQCVVLHQDSSDVNSGRVMLSTTINKNLKIC